MLSEILSAVIFGSFLLLLVVGAASTFTRWVRYRRAGIPAPVLLIRDAMMLGGLALPFLLIAAVRAFGLQAAITGEDGPQLWWLVITGVPAVLAIAVYVYYELAVIERVRPDRPETVIEREDREVGDTRRSLQDRNQTGPEAGD